MTHSSASLSPQERPFPDQEPASETVDSAPEHGADADLSLLLEQFLHSIVGLAGAQGGVVRVLTDDSRHLRLVGQFGLPPSVAQFEQLVSRDCGICGVAISRDVLGWVDDVHSCARMASDAYFGSRCQRVLAISLPYGRDILGVYTLFFEAKTELSPATESMLRLIGQLLGLTLHNARVERERLRVTVMRERQEMVNEVHDAIAQTLAYVKMRLPLLNDAMLAHDDARSTKYYADVKSAVGEVHDNLREVMTYFRTRMDPMGLLHALQGVASTFSDRNGVALEIRNSVPHLSLTDTQEVQVFHIIQESLANIAKHSMARHAVVAINSLGEHMEFLIEDDGLGMDAPSVSTIVTTAAGLGTSAHFGIEIMQARARRLGGSVEVSRNSGGGTRVRLVIPQRLPSERSA